MGVGARVCVVNPKRETGRTFKGRFPATRARLHRWREDMSVDECGLAMTDDVLTSNYRVFSPSLRRPTPGVTMEHDCRAILVQTNKIQTPPGRRDSMKCTDHISAELSEYLKRPEFNARAVC